MGFFQNRKLIGEPIINATELCRPICENADISPTSYCPTPCKFVCPQKCISYLSTPPPSPTSPSFDTKTPNSHKASTFLVVTIALLAASFLLVCGYALYAKYYNASRRRNNNDNDNDNDPSSRSSNDPDQITREFLDEEHGATVDHHVWYIRTVGLEPSIIASITALKYNKDDGLIEGTDCSVCLSEFQEDETLRLLPKCSHAFHVACIDTWLRSHTNCPMCRAPVLVAAVKASPAPAPAPETSSSGAEEETRVAISASNVEVEGDLGQSSSGEVEQRIEPSRRSASLDCLDDKVTLEVVNKLRTNGEKRVCGEKKLQRLRSGGSSHNNGRSSGHQSGHGSSMKRSHSCNGKFVLRRPIRITDSILPLRSV